MALKATVYKAEVSISDIDRHYYATHSLVLARHPSETTRRLMVRLLAFALHADERLTFTRGLSTPEEPDLWRKGLDGGIELWIDLGQPDERRIRKACSRAAEVVVVSYGDARAAAWKGQLGDVRDRSDKLTILHVADASLGSLESMASRNMQLQCSIDGGQVWLSSGAAPVELSLARW